MSRIFTLKKKLRSDISNTIFDCVEFENLKQLLKEKRVAFLAIIELYGIYGQINSEILENIELAIKLS